MKWVRRSVIKLLDRPGGRALLGRLATAFARRSAPTARVFHDGENWIRALGDRYCVDEETFTYYTDQLSDYTRYFNSYFNLIGDLWKLTERPGPGGTVIDIGAGVGLTTQVLAEAVGEGGRVLAIEAHPRTFRLLQKAVTMNRLTNTECVHSAILAEPGTVGMGDDDWASNRVQDLGDPGSEIRVDGDNIDNLCARYGIEHVDLLYMNIEGAERLAIQGMSHMLPRIRSAVVYCHDFIADETGTDWYRTKELICDFFAGQGFEVITTDGDPHLPFRDRVIARRT